MLTRQRKAEIVEELRRKLQNACGVYLVDFVGMTVEDSRALRRELRPKGIEYKIAKNTLIRRALRELKGYEQLEAHLVGQTGLVLSYTDAVAPARLLRDFIKRTEKPRFKGAVVEGQYFSGAQLEQLAALPSREELMAGIVASLQAPAAGIAGATAALLRELLVLIEEVARKQSGVSE